MPKFNTYYTYWDMGLETLDLKLPESQCEQKEQND